MKKKDTYVYPAVLTYEEGYEIAVEFPDFPGCATSGADEADALAMAKEALGGRIWCMEADKEVLPAATALRNVTVAPNERAVLVEVYMPAVRMSQENRAVSRTVTVPAWLNAAALSRGVNFSQALQQALIGQLGINRP